MTEESEENLLDDSNHENTTTNKQIPKDTNISNVKEEKSNITKYQKVQDSKVSTNTNSISKNSEDTITDKTSLKKDETIVKSELKEKKPIPLEKKPFIEFINDHLIPELLNEFMKMNLSIQKLNLSKGDRPVTGGNCSILKGELNATHSFWLCFEKEDINSIKTFSICGLDEKPSVVESFLIDERKTTLKLIVSRLLQRFNGQKLLGPN
tara:strand:+ start:3598 stop:4224 length:627 start_codon:yes stop_codon:yes gene_type:complete